MSKIAVGDKFILTTFFGGGREMARVLEIKGRWFKKYLCAVWGEHADGSHDWPNGSVSVFENVLDATELLQGEKVPSEHQGFSKLAPKARKGR